MVETVIKVSEETVTTERVVQFLRWKAGTKATEDDVAFASKAAQLATVLLPQRDVAFVTWGLGALAAADAADNADNADNADAKEVASLWRFVAARLAAASSRALAALPNNKSPFSAAENLLRAFPSCSHESAHHALTVLRLWKEKTRISPTLDQDASLAATACTALIREDSIHEDWLRLASHALQSAKDALNAIPNQKKAFQLFLSKLVEPSLILRWHLSRMGSKLDRNALQIVDTIQTTVSQMLESTLFHKEHIPEFVTTLQLVTASTNSLNLEERIINICSHFDTFSHTHPSKSSGGKSGSNKETNRNKDKIANNSKEKLSYPSQLFESLATLLKDGPNQFVLDAFPFLLQSFITARKRFLKSHDSSLDFSADSACFMVLLALLVRSGSRSSTPIQIKLDESLARVFKADGESLLITRPDKDTSGGSIGVVGRLVRVLADDDVYKATMDNVSRDQLALLKDLTSVLVRVASETLPVSQHGVIFDALSALLLVDYEVVSESVAQIWALLVAPGENSRDSVLQFITLLLRSLSKSRQLESFLLQSFDAMEGCAAQQLASSVLVNEQFLKVFSTAVSQTLPSQLPSLLKLLTSRFLDKSGTEPPSPQRRRLDLPSPNPQITLYAPESTQILAHLIGRFLLAAAPKVISTPTLKSQFAVEMDSLFDNVVIPLLAQSNLNVDDKERSSSPRKRTHYDSTGHENNREHALRLLLALMQSCHEFWERKIRTEFVVAVVGERTRVHEANAAVRLLQTRIALFHAESVASGCLDPRREVLAAELVTIALDGVQDILKQSSLEQKWIVKGGEEEEGVGLDVAVWACLVDHLVPVCHLASAAQIDYIVEILIGTIKGESNSEERISLKLISAGLLQSSQFYELRPIRDIFVSKLIAEIVSTVESDREQDPLTIKILQLLKEGQKATPLSASVARLLSSQLPTRPSVSPIKLVDLTKLVSILNTFPTVYFLNAERDCLVCVLVLLEVIIIQSASDSSDSVVFLAMCRKLESRFMESRDDTLLTLFSPRILEWFMHSARKIGSQNSTPSCDSAVTTLMRETLFIEELTVGKLVQRFSAASLPKGSLSTPAEYLSEIVDSLLGFIGDGEADGIQLDFVLHFLRAIVAAVPAKKRSDAGEMESEEVDERLAHLNSVVVASSRILCEIETQVMKILQRILTEKDVSLSWNVLVSGLRIFEQLIIFKEGYGVLENTMSLSEMFHVADACLSTVSLLIQGHDISASVVDLGAHFLSIQLHQLEGQVDVTEISVMKTVLNSCWAILKAAWGKIPHAIKMIHGALQSFAQKSSLVSEFLNLSLDLLESLLPISLGIDNVLSGTSDLPSALDLVMTLIAGIQKSGKRGSIRKALQRIYSDCARIIEASANVDLTIQSVILLSRLSEDKMLEMNRSDISLILNACSMLSAKHSRLSKTTTKSNGYLGPDDLFDAFCRLLTSILTQRREPLVDSIPAFVGVIRGLFHCFKRDLGGLQSNSDSANANVPTFSQSPYPYFSKFKLDNPVIAAESLARILQKMTQKSSLMSSGSHDSATAQTILQSNASATVRPFSKHAGLLVAEFVAIQASLSPFPGNVKKALMSGIFALLDLSGDFGRKAILAGLDALQFGGGASVSSGAAKLVYKDIVKEWESQSYFKGGE